MIRVTMLRRAGQTLGFDCTGHADYAEPGQDIVCSAVSALTQTAILGLVQVAKIQLDYSVDESGAHCILGQDTAGDARGKAALLFDTMELGLRSIDEAYPGTIKILEREV